MASETDQRGKEPPEGFAVMREADLDPEQGRATHWLYRGAIGPRRFIRPGYSSREQACRGAWVVYRMALTVDERYQRQLKQRRLREVWRTRAWVDAPGVQDEYVIRLDTWDHMEAQLLAQIIEDAGSIRRAAIAIDLPRSTLGARVNRHCERGTWPDGD
ncbi:hypothetical protein ENSA5_42760 [Enhygromyxa salina]|uniref:Uncharacterized protein n=2 Tax=Enhygromyxa salina TaxID=215803 RepID=A0A2S9XKL5_9BACT|nr:hypothetical protein ENSA5_42760 [Enhygromyxa salina]